jgi:hypothetical protein
MANGQAFFDRIDRYQLDPELLMGALEAIADMDPADRKSFEGRTITIIRFVHERDIPDDERSDAAMAINFRLMALAKLDLPAFPVWRVVAERTDDPDLLHEDVLRCAADEPLVRDPEDLSFDRGRFTKRLADITARRIARDVHQTASGNQPA